jgi:serine/threonine-protein kinase RsbW
VNSETSAPSSDSDATPAGKVEIRVPADGAYIATLRLSAASLATRCDLTVDEIEDLRLAVDEACALLLDQSGPSDALEAVFTMVAGELTVEVSVPAREGAKIERGGFGWTVLGALASSVDVAHEAGRLAITVTKRREAASR